MGEKWIRADKLAEEWKMTAIQFVDHLKNDEHVKRNGLTPHNDKLTSINEVAIGNLGAIYFLSTEIMAIEKERCETNELYRTALKSKDPYDKEHVRPLLRHCGLSDADMDALLSEVKPQSDTAPITTAPVPVVAKSVDDHIKQRRDEGINVNVIVVELYDKNGSFKLTQLEICRKLDLGKDLQPNQIDAMKKRVERAYKKGKTMLAKAENEKS